jgi:hypothetical protein
MINWNQIFSEMGNDAIRDFAEGRLSGRALYEEGFWTASRETRGYLRSLLRSHGVTEARQLARKALRRRGVRV